MTVYNNGDVMFSRALKADELKQVEGFIHEKWKYGTDGLYTSFQIDQNGIYLESHVENEIEDFFKDLIQFLHGMDVTLEGTVDYSGDNDGRVYVDASGAVSYPITSVWEIEATDEDLIRVLAGRGYTVTLNT